MYFNGDSAPPDTPSCRAFDAAVDGRSWQESKNQMTSDGNSRRVGGHLACSNKHSDHSAFLLFFFSLSFPPPSPSWLSIPPITPQTLDGCLVKGL